MKFSRPPGLTLLELLVVLGLSTALAAMAALNAPPLLAEWRLAAAARQIALDVREARLRAITEGIPQRLRFEENEGTYRRQRRRGRRYVDMGPPVELPPGIHVERCRARQSSLTFQPRGHASSFGRVSLRNRSGRRRSVVVDMVGRVRIE